MATNTANGYKYSLHYFLLQYFHNGYKYSADIKFYIFDKSLIITELVLLVLAPVQSLCLKKQ